MCPFFVDDDHVHLIAPSWLSSTAIDLPCWLDPSWIVQGGTCQ
jgi:hypothetical protein